MINDRKMDASLLILSKTLLIVDLCAQYATFSTETLAATKIISKWVSSSEWTCAYIAQYSSYINNIAMITAAAPKALKNIWQQQHIIYVGWWKFWNLLLIFIYDWKLKKQFIALCTLTGKFPRLLRTAPTVLHTIWLCIKQTLSAISGRLSAQHYSKLVEYTYSYLWIWMKNFRYVGFVKKSITLLGWHRCFYVNYNSRHTFFLLFINLAY